jgi:hypothetical protein
MALRYEFLGRLRGDGDACFTCRGFGRYAYLHGFLLGARSGFLAPERAYPKKYGLRQLHFFITFSGRSPHGI